MRDHQRQASDREPLVRRFCCVEEETQAQHFSAPASVPLSFQLIKVVVKMPLEKFLKVNSAENEIDFLVSDSD